MDIFGPSTFAIIIALLGIIVVFKAAVIVPQGLELHH